MWELLAQLLAFVWELLNTTEIPLGDGLSIKLVSLFYFSLGADIIAFLAIVYFNKKGGGDD